MTGKPRVAAVALNPVLDWTLTIPGFAAGQVNRVAHEQLHAGGKAVNVAAVLADYGCPVTVTGFLGAENDRLFRELFRAKGIDDRCLRIAGATRTGIKVVDPVNQQTTDINFPGQAPTAADLAALRAVVAELAADHDWFVFSGSVPPAVPAAVYRELLELVQGKCTALDTSGEPLRLAVAGGPTVVKPNRDELAELVGHPLVDLAAIWQAAHSLVRLGSACVVVSMGAQGALFVTAEHAVLATPPAVAVQSTVGAGDAMVAGVIAAHAQGLALTECARLATAFAVSAVTRVGAGLPAPAVIAGYGAGVTVQVLTSP